VNHREVVARLSASLDITPPRKLGFAGPPGVGHAAVAVLLVDRGGEAYVVLTVRSAELRSHSGQISLPGGMVDPGDRDTIAAAQRETDEELGLPPSSWQVIGAVDDVVSRSGFVVTPVVGELADPVYRPNPGEVAAVFEAPLALFADTAVAEVVGTREYLGESYVIRAYHHGEHRVWGLTARVLELVCDRAR